MKKVLSLVLVLSMVLGSFGFAFANEVEATPGEMLEAMGLLQGDNGDLMLDKDLKRQDMMVMLSRLLGEEEEAENYALVTNFPDVKGDYYPAIIGWAQAKGLTDGMGDGTFGFNGELTLGQTITFLLRALGYDAELAWTNRAELAVELGWVAEGLDLTTTTNRGVMAQLVVNSLYTPMFESEVTLGTKLGYEGFEVVAELEAVGAEAINQSTVVVEFSNPVGKVVANNFSIYEKGNEFAINVIEKVAVNGNFVTITLIDALAKDKEYTVDVKNVLSADGEAVVDAASFDLTYVATDAATIELKHTTVAVNDTVEVVIKDAKGNDVTANYDLATDITVETSAPSVVDANLDALAAGYAVVNVKLNNTEIETGNTIVTVKTTLSVLTQISRYTLDTGDFTKPVTTLFKSDTGVMLDVEVVDQNGDDVTADVLADANGFSFRSYSPTIAVVDETTGEIFPVAAGNASILVTAEIGSRKVSRVVTVAVKEDPKATSLKVDVASVKLVKDSTIAQDIKVEVLDQYGDTLDTTGDVSWKINKDDIVAGLQKDTAVTVGLAAGKQTITLNPGTVKGTGSLTITVGSLTRTVTVSLVEPAAFAGYTAVATSTKLDLNSDANDVNKVGDAVATINVYERDVNGNYIRPVAGNVTLETANTDAAKQPVTVSGITVSAVRVGSDTVTVKVSGVTIAKIGFTTVNTTATLTTVSQVNNAVTVDVSNGETVSTKLFGTDEKGGAFVGYDQYGEKIVITGQEAFTSNSTIVDRNFNANANGTVTLTVKIAGKLHTIIVKVIGY